LRPIIDFHLDLGWNALSWKRDLTLPVDEINRAEGALTDDNARGNATVSLPEMRRGRVALCLGTLLARAPRPPAPRARFAPGDLDHRSQDMAYAAAAGQLAYYRALEARGEVKIIRDRRELDEHWESWRRARDSSRLPIGIIVAFEGSDPIVAPAQAAWWFDQGVRCASIVHYGRGAYALGTGDDGPLTPAGRELLGELERLGIILDVTHLSDTSFFEALDRFGGPLLASHNNCRAIVPGDRQFTNEQLGRIIARGGVIGVAADAWMLHPGWVIDETSREVVAIEAMADHIDHICALAGDARHAAIGSDLDGGFGREQTPMGLDTIADLQKLAGILARRGYSEKDIDRVFWGNGLEFLREHLPGG
jgi:membrane dipeptidase